MKFQCVSCKRTFVYPAKKTLNSAPLNVPDLATTIPVVYPSYFPKEIIETHVCPYCQSLDLTEYVEPQPQVEAVYVHDLTTGDQKLLSTLLAEGWVIVSRYAKQYVLEKLKAERGEEK